MHGVIFTLNPSRNDKGPLTSPRHARRLNDSKVQRRQALVTEHLVGRVASTQQPWSRMQPCWLICSAWLEHCCSHTEPPSTELPRDCIFCKTAQS
jgi:hypothetical protein